MIKDTIRSLFVKGSFTKDVFIISLSKVLVAIIGFAFIPVLSRIYTPEAFGNFSIYYAIVILLSGLYSLAYPSSLVIAKDEKAFYNLFSLSTLLLFFLTGITVLFFWIFKSWIFKAFNIQDTYFYFLIIPIGILINGGIALFTPWNVRRRQFTFSSTISVLHNLLIKIASLIFGLTVVFKHYGLIIGSQLGRLAALIAYFIKYFYKERKELIENVSLRNMWMVAKEYSNYPLYIMPSRLIENLKNQSVIYFVGIGFGSNILGHLSVAISVLNVPIQILANSMSSVFIKTANDIYVQDRERLPPFIKKLLKKLFIIGVFPFSILTVFGEDIIRLFLGDQWVIAGKISSILSPYFFAILIVSPVVSILQILKKERQLFIFNFTGFSLNIMTLIIGIHLNDIYLLAIMYSVGNVLIYLSQCTYILIVNKLSISRVFIGLLIFSLVLFMLLVLKNLIYP